MSLVDWSYVKHSLQHITPAQLAARYAYRGVQRALKLEVYHAILLTSAHVAKVGSPATDTTFGFVSPEQLWEACEDPLNELEPEKLRRALEEGEECFGAFVDGKLACQLWLTNKTSHLYENVYVSFDPAYAYGRWAYTRPDYRGRRLQLHCQQRAFGALVEKGYRGALGLISAANYSSLRASDRVGCERIGILVATGGMENRLVWASPLCARYDMRLELGGAAPPMQPKG